MFDENSMAHPLVSVVIPCYNYGHFLGKAIGSVLNQTHENLEILVIDDGSVDNTKHVSASFPSVRYLYQKNQGLSAARNTGISNSSGDFLIFLDADDWLYPKALEINVKLLMENKDWAYVSGAFDRIFPETNQIVPVKKEISENHYLELLKGNYIGMPAVLMFQKWALEKEKFDTTDPNIFGCEDYDLTLRLARKYPIGHHIETIAAYHIHGTNMSSHIPRMLKSVLNTLERQKPYLKNQEEFNAFEYGCQNWKNYYTKQLYLELITGRSGFTKGALTTLLKHQPGLLLKAWAHWARKRFEIN